MYQLELNHEILDESLVKERLSGFSLSDIQDTINELKNDPDFRNDIYESILNAELLSVPMEMSERCPYCEVGVPCCEANCELFERAVEYKKRINKDFDICYHCPEKDISCTGFENSHLRRMKVDKVKDICFSPRRLFKEGIIRQETLDNILSNKIDIINSNTYNVLENFLPSDELRSISNYAFKEIERFGIAIKNTNHTITALNAIVNVQLTRSGAIMGVITFDSKKTKFFIKKEYISLQEKSSQDILIVIENKVKEILGEDYKLPKKVYVL
jgi:hypothetical protein